MQQTSDDIGQMRVRAEFLLHHAKTKVARNTASALLILLKQQQKAWDAAPADTEAMAKLFHENYERLAPFYNYQTRPASAVPWKKVPPENRALMIETCKAVMASLGGPDA